MLSNRAGLQRNAADVLFTEPSKINNGRKEGNDEKEKDGPEICLDFKLSVGDGLAIRRP